MTMLTTANYVSSLWSAHDMQKKKRKAMLTKYQEFIPTTELKMKEQIRTK